MAEMPIRKLYYSISEVSEIAGLKPFVLRYWETEFTELHPSKNRAGNRIYRRNDIELILKIKELLYTEKYTIAGAKQRLKSDRLKNAQNERPRQLSLTLGNVRDEALLNEIADDLKGVVEKLDEILSDSSGRGAVR